jgi:hypothetical protein
MSIYGTVSKTGWVAKPAHVVAEMGYDERKAYEAGRRAEMAAQGVTEAQLNETPSQMHRRMMKALR